VTRTPDGYDMCPSCGHHTSACVGGCCTAFVLGSGGMPEYCRCDCYKVLHGVSLFEQTWGKA
jgi:hypothetical protein